MFGKLDDNVKSALAKIQGMDMESQTVLAEFAKAIELPLRKGLMPGNTVNGIFTPMDFSNTHLVEFPVDGLVPGTEKEYSAFVIPNCGYIPQRSIESDFVTVPTYMVGNAIDWCIKHERDSGYNFVGRNLQIFRDGFITKMNDDGWHVILSAGLSRGIIPYDSAAPAGYFTKRLVSLSKLVMRRNGGGNSTSLNRGKLTDMFVSPEGLEDMRNWNVDQVDEITRREIFLSPEDGLSMVFGVRLHPLDELGVGQEYQDYFDDELSGTMPPGKQEIVVGLDLSRDDSFVMPIRQPLVTYPDPTLLRQMRAGVFGWTEIGLACLNAQRVLFASF